MDDLLERKTGDATYRDRVARFQYVMARLNDKPKPTYDTIGKELGITRQNVARLVKRGTVKPAGRQPTNEGRKKALRARLDKWHARMVERAANGKSTDREVKWISDLAEQLATLE